METVQTNAAAGIAAITGGNTLFLPAGAAKGGIPLIALSSGSVAAGGGISGITALPIAYPAAYCWFPANILAASIAAGWYYCTFSSTTTGTAFLNTYTSGVPAIPASPTAVTAGQGAFTGVIGELFAQTFTIPANALGINGQILGWFQGQQNSTANNKVFRARYSGTGGTILFALNQVSTQKSAGGQFVITNAGVTNVQTAGALALHASPDNNNAPAGLGVDTTAATSVVFSMEKALATDNMITQSAVIGVLQ
jgi:hypothetical protein